MNYFDLYPLHPDQNILAAWDSQVVEAARTPRLTEVFEKSGSELLTRFAACYVELRALPRSARRSLQRRIARSAELAAILPEWFRSGGGRALQYKLARSLAGAALLLALGQGIVEATTINVTTTNPGVRRDKKCSLIEAIVNANADAQVHRNCPAGSGADTIVLPANADIKLNLVNNKTYGRTGLPVITSSITIEGNGAEIVGNNKNRKRPFRLIAVGNTGELTLQNINLSGGGGLGSADKGGGVLNHGTLVIQNSAISGNSANNNGAGVANFGDLIVQNSTISGNSIQWNGGGGVHNSGTATIENSIISGNRGGGVSNLGGTLTIENSSVSGNEAGYDGGGVSSDARWVNIANSTISQNPLKAGSFCFYSSYYSPGAVYCFYLYSGTLTIANSIISENSAQWRGGGVRNVLSTVTIENSTITGNTAYQGGGVSNTGGGYNDFYGKYIPPGSLSLVDSTITENVAGDSGGGLFNEGTLSMSNSTISNNQAPVGPDIFP